MNICCTPKATLRVPRPPVQTPPPQLAVQQRLGKETKTVHVQVNICTRAHADLPRSYIDRHRYEHIPKYMDYVYICVYVYKYIHIYIHTYSHILA